MKAPTPTPPASRELRHAWTKAYRRRHPPTPYPERVGELVHISVPLRRVLEGLARAGELTI
jgi:hypothetical protein